MNKAITIVCILAFLIIAGLLLAVIIMRGFKKKDEIGAICICCQDCPKFWNKECQKTKCTNKDCKYNDLD